MHEYSVNSRKRFKSIIILAIISAYIALLIQPYIASFSQTNYILGYFLSASPFVIFGIIFYLVDTCLWCTWPFDYFLKMPNFNGEWIGTGETTYTKIRPQKFKVTIRIIQTFTKIMIDSQFASSYSESFNASIDNSNQSRSKLIYSYENKAQPTAKGIQDHIGTIELCKTNSKTLQGNYFTNRKPLTSGTLNLTKKVANNV